jgi:hypothetical protein
VDSLAFVEKNTCPRMATKLDSDAISLIQSFSRTAFAHAAFCYFEDRPLNLRFCKDLGRAIGRNPRGALAKITSYLLVPRAFSVLLLFVHIVKSPTERGPVPRSVLRLEICASFDQDLNGFQGA